MTSAICATTSGVKRTVIITNRYASSTDPASERMGFEALRLRDTGMCRFELHGAATARRATIIRVEGWE